MLDLDHLTEEAYLAEKEVLIALRRERQVVPTDELIRQLERLGFTCRQPGSSHVSYKNKKFRVYGGLVANSKKRSPQFGAARDCLMVLEMAWSRLTVKAQPVAEQFQDVAQASNQDLFKNIPERYEVLPHAHDDLLILRHRGRPCIGTVVPRQMPADALSDTLWLLDEEVRELEMQIERATDMEFREEDQDRTLNLINPYSETRIHFAPFTGADDEHALSALTDLLDKEDKNNTYLAEALGNLDKNPNLRDKSESVDPLTGQKKISYRYISPVTFLSAPVEIVLSPKGKLFESELCKLLDNVWFTYWNDIRGTLKTYGGFKTKLVKDGCKSSLEAEHLIFSDIRFTIDDFHALGRSIDNVLAEGRAQDDPEVMQDLYLDLLANREHATFMINKAMAEMRTLLAGPSNRVYTVTKHLQRKGVHIQYANGRAQSRGELVRLYMDHPSLPGNSFFSCLNIVAPGGNGHISLASTADLARLERIEQALPEPPPRDIFAFAVLKGPQDITNRAIASIAEEIDSRKARRVSAADFSF